MGNKFADTLKFNDMSVRQLSDSTGVAQCDIINLVAAQHLLVQKSVARKLERGLGVRPQSIFGEENILQPNRKPRKTSVTPRVARTETVTCPGCFIEVRGDMPTCVDCGTPLSTT